MIEYRFSELRHEGGRRLSGVVVRYRDEAFIGGQFRERIERGALVPDDVVLNLSHDNKRPIARLGGGGLELKDGTDAMRMSAKLPKSRDGDDALELIRARILRGLSVEMQVARDDWSAGGRLRTIKEARLTGIGVVAKPAYPQSSIEARDEALARGNAKPMAGGYFDIELRQKQGRISGVIPYNEEAIVSMRYGERQIIRPGAFGNIGDEASDIFLLVGYEYANALASTGAGSLEVRDEKDGVHFAMTKPPPRATYARDFQAKLKANLVRGVVPGFVPMDDELVDGVRVVKKAMLCEVNLVSRSTAGGRINPTRPRVRSVRRWAV